MKNRSTVAAGLPELRAVGVVDGRFESLKIEEIRNGVITVHELPDPREKWIKEYREAISPISPFPGQHA